MHVAALQMVSGTSVQANLEAARQLLGQAAAQGAELAVLPEYFCLMGWKDSDKLAVQESAGQGVIQDFLAQSARELKLWIVGGTVPLRASDSQHVRNSALVYAPTGECIARYDKIHLFRFDNGREQYDESRVIESGAAPVTFDLPSIDGHSYRVGLSICYDLRFPELYRAMKADLLLVPSAFTYTTGQAHWETLLRARAIENLAYVVAAAQGGVHENQRRTWGQSLIVDPWGQILAQRAQGLAVVMAELRAERLNAVRLQLPALKHGVL
ncbi:MAG: carbon-nitrogen hydrolase family protein [Polaromonas sp.]|uniref:carbon-nitrogen hydrolase family protein n=1 Tax=Polaromonas sp. TaxID=1869339 RepID=UPI002733BE43|nr:carbon-nitrogen hydrolase family protein [Polaromonas sp.]MDP2817349.1 carbon-nitrogen hydrolase family protein [Polaromonas sp.]